MKYLCLVCGDEKDRKALTKEQQESLLSRRGASKRGVLMRARRQW
jgi:hypothetical protein